MPEHPLYVAIVWHMHQPFYRDLRTGEIALPWVRLHAAKDYLHMAELLADYPNVHQTINMVPSLVEQMLDWAEGREADQLVRLAEQEDWSDDDKRLILNLCYSISWDKIIRRYPRYEELLARRPAALADPAAFTRNDYLDLLGWFNLAWFDPDWLARQPALAALVARGRGFTRADLATIHAAQRQIAAGVLPLYRQLAARGQLEISTTPYYHPILPLLMDIGSARRASPGLPLPALHFAAPEDAAAQLQMAIEAHTRWFGTAPQGLWPSEGAVSPEVLTLVTAAGFRWLASDEAILGRSLGRPFERDGNNLVLNPRALYRPYRALAGTELGPYILFRDHELSDRIGFLYQHLPGAQAAEDLIYRLLEIRRRLNDPATPYLVSIILDGENCWEHYERNGNIFLRALYAGLNQHPHLKTVTVSEYLALHQPSGVLARLATGSWIGGDLTTWIGDPEHNRAWEALARTRAHLVNAAAQRIGRPELTRAWQAIYAAEGSDWFWWYSHRNNSEQNAIFDRLFRDNLAAVYEELGDEVPAALEQPIGSVVSAAGRTHIGYCTPPLTAAPFPGEAWALAAAIQPASASTGVMQRASGVIERLLVCHDRRNLYLRLDLRERLERYEAAIYLGNALGAPANQRPHAGYADPAQAPTDLALEWAIRCLPDQSTPFLSRAVGREGWETIGPVTAALGEKVLEVALPLATLGLTLGDPLSVLVVLSRRGIVAAQLPERGMAQLELQAFPE